MQAAQLLCAAQGSGSRFFMQALQVLQGPLGSVIILQCEVAEVVVKSLRLLWPTE